MSTKRPRQTKKTLNLKKRKVSVERSEALDLRLRMEGGKEQTHTLGVALHSFFAQAVAGVMVVLLLTTPVIEVYASEGEEEVSDAPTETVEEETSEDLEEIVEEEVSEEEDEESSEEESEEVGTEDSESSEEEPDNTEEDTVDETGTEDPEVAEDEAEGDGSADTATSTPETTTEENEEEEESESEGDVLGTATSTPETGDGSGSTTPKTSATTTPETGGGGGGNETDDKEQEIASTTPDVTATTTATSTPEVSEEELDDDTEEEVSEEKDEEVSEEIASTTPDVTATTTATSTPEVVEENVTEVRTLTTDESRYVFSNQECILIRDGQFLCLEIEEEQDGSVASEEDGVFAEVGKGGDKEIFINRKGKIEQVTDNDQDDDMPFYDAASKKITWHTLKNDRYQIVVYDIKDDKARQITDTPYNSMHPHMHNGVLVWQGWVENNWEIFLVKDTDDEHPDIFQLTDNAYHDVLPTVQNGYVSWRARINGVWHAFVYDINTNITEEIEVDIDGTIENPRFVLLFDSKKDNGDVETLGYDVVTKKAVPVSATPREIPDRIPKPKSSDEEPALPAKSETKPVRDEVEDDQGDDDVADAGGEVTSVLDLSTASSTDSGTEEATGTSTPIEVSAA